MDIINSFKIRDEIFYYHDITKVISSNSKLKKLPIVLKILLESNLRKAKDAIEFNKIINIFVNRMNSEITFYLSRIILQNFNSLPSLVELASIRDTVHEQGGDVKSINPKVLVDLLIDDEIEENKKINIEEKYKFVKWAQSAFSNFRVIPSGSGIYHQLNLEYLSTIIHLEKIDDKYFIYPETMISSLDEHKMMNSIGVLGLRVSDLNIESSMLGLSIPLVLPKVVGVNIHGVLKPGVTSSDLVSILINKLKQNDMSAKFVEFYGEGLKYLTLEDRTIILNMAREYKARCSFFAIDDKTIDYFNNTRENKDYSVLIKTYLEKQSFFYKNESLDYDELVDFDLSLLEPCIKTLKKTEDSIDINSLKGLVVLNEAISIKDYDVVIATISFCASNSNPYILIHAALVAKKALSLGLKVPKHIKTSLVLNSLIVKEYLEKLDLLKYLEELGFSIIAYSCSDYNSRVIDLDKNIQEEIKHNNLNVCSLSSFSRGVEERNNALIKSNYLISASLVVVYSLVGSIKFDIFEDTIEQRIAKDVYLKDIWPTQEEVGRYLSEIDSILYKDIYKNMFKGDESWRKLIVKKTDTYSWDENSTYIKASNFFNDIDLNKIDIKNAGILVLLGDKITSDSICASGNISLYSSASKYLEENGVKSFEYNSFESRACNAEVMVRGTLDNSNIKNSMVSKEGGYTKDYESNEIVSIYEKSQIFKKLNKSLVIFAGREFGIGNSMSWAVKGVKLLGVKVIIAKSFDLVFKADLVRLGVLPLEFIDDDIQSLKLKGNELISIEENEIKADSKIVVIIHKDEVDIEIELKCRLDNEDEVSYYKNGGVLSYLLKNNVT